MAKWGFIRGLVTLDSLYSTKTAKGRIHLLIFLVFKVVAPTWPLMLIRSDSILVFEDDIMKHFKLTKYGRCEDFEHSQLMDLLDLEDEHNANIKINNDIANLWQNYTEIKPRDTLNQNSPVIDNINSSDNSIELIRNYYKLFESQKHAAILQQDEIEISNEMFCCYNYRKLVNETVLCMRKMEEYERKMPFWMALYIPFFSCVLTALILAPLKRNPSLQRTLFKRSINEEAYNENIEKLKNYLQYIADLAAFYIILYQIRTIGYIIQGQCIKQSKCLPHHTSPQMVFLLVLAQAPWTSLVWNLVY